MSFHRYPVATLQKVSQLIRETLVIPTLEPTSRGNMAADGGEAEEEIPDSLDALGDLFRVGDMPEDNLPAPNVDGRWFVSTINPAESLSKLPSLWLKAGIRMVTYLKHEAREGTGVTVALPALLSTTERLEAAIQMAEKTGNPPHPEGCLESILDGLEGDGSLASFLAASIFAREIREFGRTGQQIRWGHHKFIAAIPPKVKWDWRTKPPEDLSPKVATTQDEHIVVEFFSCRVQKPVALFRHVDRYPPDSYHATTKDQVIAVMAGAVKK